MSGYAGLEGKRRSRPVEVTGEQLTPVRFPVHEDGTQIGPSCRRRSVYANAGPTAGLPPRRPRIRGVKASGLSRASAACPHQEAREMPDGVRIHAVAGDGTRSSRHYRTGTGEDREMGRQVLGGVSTSLAIS